MTKLDEIKSTLGEHFEKLQEKLKPYAKKYGRMAAKPLLELFYVLRQDSTPTGDKVIIALALAYVLLPTDLLPLKKFGLLGVLDDALSLNVVYKKMQKNITPETTFQVEMTLDKWFEGQSCRQC